MGNFVKIILMDTLGNRMKRYEKVSELHLTPKVPVIIRVDGRAFHTFLKNTKKPFDSDFVSAMIQTADEVSKELSGFTLAYVQSDEASFLISDLANDKTQPWYGNDAIKIVSIVSSLFTARFNRIYVGSRSGYPDAVFDARAFNIPSDEIGNYFVWRQKDWIRNSAQMYGRSYFTQKELHGKNIREILEKVKEKGGNWDTIPAAYRFGTYITRDHTTHHTEESYWSLSHHLGVHVIEDLEEQIPVEEE